MNFKTILTMTVASASLVAVAASPVVADDTGVAQALHAITRVGGKSCFVDHAHTGSGSGASRKIAEMQAINNWASFTAFEYGSDWAKFGKAVKKSMTCNGSGGSFNCTTEATPCK